MPSAQPNAPTPSSTPGVALRSAVRAAFWTLTALALPASLLTTAAWFLEAPALFAQLSPFRVQYAALLAAHALFALALRRPRWSAVFAAFALFNLGAVLHATLGFTAPPAPPATAPHTASAAGADSAPALRPLKIVYANVLTSNDDPAPLLALIAAEKPDLVALLEINARWSGQLLAALGTEFPFQNIRPREDNFGVAIFSRIPLGHAHVKIFADHEIPSIELTWLHPAGDIRILLTHPLPPGDDSTNRLRNQHLDDLTKWHRAIAGHSVPGASAAPVILLGDLNATPWCPPLRRLLAATGLRPAAADHGLVAATWPALAPFLRIPLDHALLSSNLACVSYRVGPDVGSDHFPLILEVALVP